MACGNSSDSVLSNGFVVCELCDEEAEARNHCDECLTNFCDRCARSHGKRFAGKERHRVEQGVCCYNMELELCPEDGQKMSFFCQSCQLRVCPQCELKSKRHLMHEVVTLDQQVGCEKEKLLDRLDDVTTKTETINYLPEDIKAMATQIELKWLERKELMRQEFASLLETITTQQQKLMADMEEEVKLSLQHLENLQKAHEKMLSTTCQLSDDCISAVQSLPRDEFLKSYPQFLESAKSLVNQVEKMSSPDDCMPAFLQLPFSLHTEKVHLHDCLQLGAYDCQRIKAIEYNRFIPHDRVKEEIAVNMLVNCPQPGDIPTSCTLHYAASIFCGSRQNKQKPIWVNKEPLLPTDVVLNGSHGFKLVPAWSLYLVKIHPVITVTTHQGERIFDGKVVSIVIVTDKDTDVVRRPLAAGDGQVIDTATDTSRLLGTKCKDFLGDTGALTCFNTAWAGNQNNNNNSSTRNDNNNSTLHNNNSVSNSIVSLDKSTILGHLIRPVIEAVFQVPGFSGGSSGGKCASSFEKKPVFGRNMFEKGFINEGDKDRMQCQRRFVSICSFEEARLLEDTHLKV